MAIQDLYIKNMICSRCTRAVRQDLEKQGYQVHRIELGMVTVEKPEIDLFAIAHLLEEQGFGLLTDRYSRLVNQLKTRIVELIQSGRIRQLKTTLSDYLAEQLGMEYTHLSHLFSMSEQVTLEKYWILQRVEKAKELLSYRELSIHEIDLRLGYRSAAYLTSQFKQITGLTPAAYRNRSSSDRKPIDWI
jgi:AraC-like DNA-binding protein